MLTKRQVLTALRGRLVTAHRLSLTHYSDMFLVNCPRCRSPLTLRTGVTGSHYHCRCTARPQPQARE
jgi:hypothetical protein